MKVNGVVGQRFAHNVSGVTDAIMPRRAKIVRDAPIFQRVLTAIDQLIWRAALIALIVNTSSTVTTALNAPTASDVWGWWVRNSTS